MTRAGFYLLFLVPCTIESYHKRIFGLTGSKSGGDWGRGFSLVMIL